MYTVVNLDPAKLLSTGVRIIDIQRWCFATFGPDHNVGKEAELSYCWASYSPYATWYFSNPAHATLFALKWL